MQDYPVDVYKETAQRRPFPRSAGEEHLRAASGSAQISTSMPILTKRQLRSIIIITLKPSASIVTSTKKLQQITELRRYTFRRTNWIRNAQSHRREGLHYPSTRGTWSVHWGDNSVLITITAMHGYSDEVMAKGHTAKGINLSTYCLDVQLQDPQTRKDCTIHQLDRHMRAATCSLPQMNRIALRCSQQLNVQYIRQEPRRNQRVAGRFIGETIPC